MNGVLIRNIQRMLGVGGLAWAIFLLPRTSFVWWIAANLLYGVLALTSASLLRRGHTRKGWAAAIAGLLLFVAVNGAVAMMACSAGGACVRIVAVIAAIVPMQLAVVFVEGWFISAQPLS
jgi:hypothetical protein